MPERPSWRTVRSAILFFSGLGGIMYEAYESAHGHPADQALVLIFASMMGLPAFFAFDNRRNGNGNGKH